MSLPALFIVPGFDRGGLSFVLYREPKLAAFMVLGWVLLAWLWVSLARRVSLEDIRRVVCQPAVASFLLFVAYATLSLGWTTVRENGLYEVTQYVTLALLLVVLLVWQQVDGRVTSVVRWALVASLAVVSVIGILQALWPAVMLPPINPYGEVGHPSLMGYKNPAAMVVLGQLFLLWQLASANPRWHEIHGLFIGGSSYPGDWVPHFAAE